jgi:hypothetical protein
MSHMCGRPRPSPAAQPLGSAFGTRPGLVGSASSAAAGRSHPLPCGALPQDVIMSGLLFCFTRLTPPHARTTLVAAIRLSR